MFYLLRLFKLIHKSRLSGEDVRSRGLSLQLIQLNEKWCMLTVEHVKSGEKKEKESANRRVKHQIQNLLDKIVIIKHETVVLMTIDADDKIQTKQKPNCCYEQTTVTTVIIIIVINTIS